MTRIPPNSGALTAHLFVLLAAVVVGGKETTPKNPMTMLWDALEEAGARKFTFCVMEKAIRFTFS